MVEIKSELKRVTGVLVIERQPPLKYLWEGRLEMGLLLSKFAVHRMLFKDMDNSGSFHRGMEIMDFMMNSWLLSTSVGVKIWRNGMRWLMLMQVNEGVSVVENKKYNDSGDFV